MTVLDEIRWVHRPPSESLVPWCLWVLLAVKTIPTLVDMCCSGLTNGAPWVFNPWKVFYDSSTAGWETSLLTLKTPLCTKSRGFVHNTKSERFICSFTNQLKPTQSPGIVLLCPCYDNQITAQCGTIPAHSSTYWLSVLEAVWKEDLFLHNSQIFRTYYVI